MAHQHHASEWHNAKVPKDSGAKHAALQKAKKEPYYGPGAGYRKIDVYHDGVYAHSTNFAKNTKIAKAKSGLSGGKITAKYDKNR